MKRVVLVAVVMLMAVPAMWAQDEIIDEMVEACKPDIEAYCSQVTPGDGRLLACFYAHGDKISAKCEYALYEGAAQLEQFANALTYLAKACQADLEKHCAEVELGEGRVATCLIEHKAEVSEECAKAMQDTELEVVED